MALTSLHYYFPWAMKALVKWCVFALATAGARALTWPRTRSSRSPTSPAVLTSRNWRGIGDLADDYFETDRYLDFCATSLGHVDELVLDWVAGPDFDGLLTETVRAVYPAAEHDQFIAHLRGLTGLWVGDEGARLR